MVDRSILVDEEVFATLQGMAEPLVDDANTVLRRVLSLAPATADAGSPPGLSSQAASGHVEPTARPGEGRSTLKRSVDPRTAKSASSRRKRSTASRAPAGSLLPELQYELPLLEALLELGGSAPTSEVVDRLGKELDDKLTEGDRETLSSGEVRWKNRVQFVRLGLIKGGHMMKDSPRGVWEITDAGRQRVAAEAGA